MSDLINGKDLYEKIADLEADMRKKLLSTPRDSEAYIRYVERLNERSFFKHEIMDAPKVSAEPQWIPCSERLPEYNTEVLISREKNRHEINIGYRNKEFGWYDQCYSHIVSDVIAWMPLPHPYKGE